MNKNPPRRARALTVGLVALLLAALAAALVLWRQWAAAGEGSVPAVSVTLDGEELLQHGGSWETPLLGGLLTRRPTLSYPALGKVLALDSDQPLLAAAPADAALSRVRVSRGGDALFDGSPEAFAAFRFPGDGDYFVEVWGSLDRGGDGRGDFYFDASVALLLPVPEPEFSLSSADAQQGDLLTVTARHIPEGVTPSGESGLGYVRFVPAGEPGVYTALVPVGYAREPGAYTIEVTAGQASASLPVTVAESDFEVQQMTISEEIADETVNSQAANWEFHVTVVPLYDTANDERYWSVPFLQPVEGRISTPYGVKRYVNGGATPERHGGVDIAAALGTPVQCPADGLVEYAGFLQLSGNTIVIEHGGGLKSYFYHMDSLDVATGDRVEKGRLLGAVGTTGYSTGPHLHYEVKIGRESVSPWPLFDGSSAIFAADAG